MKKILFLLVFLGILFTGCLKEKESIKEEKGVDTYSYDVGDGSVTFGGEQYRMGYIPESEEIYRSYPVKRASYRGTLPSMVDLSTGMPNVGNQGSQGSCTAWATGYAYKTYQEKKDRGWNVINNTKTQFSPAYIYNQINGGRDQGSYIDAALKLIVSQGCSTLSAMPYNQRDYLTQPNSSQRTEASNYKALTWGTVPDGNVEEFKKHLASGDPVVVGVPVYPDFDVSSSNPIYDNTNGTLNGYHAITFCGYDDSKKAFKLINSWGTSWGFSGYGWMSYDLVSRLRIRGYVMTDRKDGTNPEPQPEPKPEPQPEPKPIINLALNKPTSISSNVYNSDYTGAKAVDGDKISSRWIAKNDGTNTWITVDLQNSYNINKINTVWSTANYSKKYTVFGWNGSSWEAIKIITGTGGVQSVDIGSTKKYRYVSLNLSSCSSNYYVLYELEIY